ncbi:peptidoglycan hydrolase-like protein with peptidoglycan-binding domain [Bradyrhizobium elkanii]|uniref:N-acetylmuramidase domain-containing protein n=1 Tax=Bradyrhizobium elkanii TaxID=29448 RepID=UPI002167AEBF|nr:N-acetylmuramidase domain-containing protein [Bradyrhizobium elkanii]MCS3449837.1 peptidoglycan hydrolase-like protein with peptidoglycan-binding domain [Bradyrhizobium elkanii]MCS3559020.1 peptidoglycan hydrolase-like protein with peptidoglycan-binding domain [Bradyrhizobium elkanii]MCW2151134.1 peptidoglycan hydrolase-like protein with peptidoglycan-binding domain [Bradyrhizobium elkanii]MCW2374865.1 peptidoglycan hydrolase-like protein with peptidoglycan-binding domain [Bradyrhizobium elk
MFSKEIVDAIVAAANANGWPASALLAVVECETSGKPFEQDNHTPALLFERHKFYSELQSHKPMKLKDAIKAGLAIPKWSRNTQYKDQGTSAGRLNVIAKARQIDEEVANRAASWGLGQTMGFNAERLHYDNATAMVEELSKGVAEQIEALVREIKSSKLDRFLKAKDFASFAKGYNGPGYKQNNYDVRMRNADAVWARRLASGFEAKPSKTITVIYQSKLKELGYPVGTIDGDWGDLTTGSTSAFQRKEGLKITGHPNDETTQHLENATADQAREPSAERQTATVDDLRAAGSQTVQAADKGSLVSKILVGSGVIGGASQTGLLDQAKDMAGQAQTAKSVLDSIRDLAAGLAPYWWVGVIVVGFITWRLYGDVIKRRLEDHQAGVHLG